MALPEPWLRGPIAGLDQRLAPLLYSFQMAVEDLETCTSGLSDADLWTSPTGLAPVGFQLRHITGSTDRLATYLRGEQLSDQQKAVMAEEAEPRGTRESLLENMRQVFDRVSADVRAIDPAAFADPRGVGRKALPTTVLGLIVHIAEHTQRHVGEAIVTVKALKAMSR